MSIILSMLLQYKWRAKVDLRPIKTEQEYDAALAAIERLFDAEPGIANGDALEVLTLFVDAYEAEHYAIEAPDPVEAILYYVESRGLSRRDLEPFIGSRSRVSEVLNRKRPLTLAMIRRLHVGLGIPAEILIQPYPTSQAAA
jgi:HTH-type transcriptional regulator / antitoxin HigA